ncbi:MAG: hypothetical protein LBL73_05105 [Synergistaceae bacterium]|nr:hypothetical protein [Synergistaceae bacterium]
MERGIKEIKFIKKLVASMVLAIFVSDISAPVIGAAWADGLPLASAGLNVSAVLKDEVGLDDTDILSQPGENGRKANVLFMIDATAGMSFSMKSAVPSVVLPKNWKDSGDPGADWPETKRVYGYTGQQVADMMANATYGIGAMPVAWTGATLREERNLYGRDIDSSNNYVKMSDDPLKDAMSNDNYYTPFKDTGDTMIGNIKNAYAQQGLPLQTEYSGAGQATHSSGSHWNLSAKEVGTSVSKYTYSKNSKISGAKSFPYALIFKDPNYWEKGYPGLKIGDKPSRDLLVPNDSRMYQAKLALWKLLENDEVTKSIRFGLASTFLPTTNDANFCYDKSAKTTPPNYKKRGGDHTNLDYRYDFSGMYKVAPFGGNVFNKADTVDYKKGVLVQAVSGHVRGYNAIHAQYYPMWQHKTVESVYSMIDKKNKGSNASIEKNFYKLLHRGSLLVPIRGADERWDSSGLTFGTRTPMSQIARVRQWINGFADLFNGSNSTEKPIDASDTANRSSQYHYYRDPEIGVAGVFVLPHAIFPDPRSAYGMTRANYKSKILTGSTTVTSDKDGADGFATSIWYSHKTNNTDYRYNRSPGSTQLEDDEAEIKSRFNAGSGEAAGSVLDFFSPPAGLYQSSLSAVSYPIRSACEPNWLVLFTTGQELKPGAGEYSYTAAEAIKNLYDATNKAKKGSIYERVSMLVRGADGKPKGSAQLTDLDQPIQTLVVGLVPKIESMSGAEKTVVEQMHLNLAKMAVAGQGGNPNDVTLSNMGSFEAQPFLASDTSELESALIAAMTMIKDSTEMQPGTGAVVQSEVLDDLGENSDVYSYNYRIMKTDQWEAELTREIVSKDENGKLRFIKKWTAGEKSDGKIVPKNGDRKIYYWNTGGTNTLSELGANDSGFISAAGLADSGFNPPNGKDFGGVTPKDAMIRWLKGKDYSYSNKRDYARQRMLADFGQSGIVMVNDPAVCKGETLSGYREWALKISDDKIGQKPLLFAQTNDGLLRIIDPSSPNSGKEMKAILPPPLLIPSRLASLKAGLVGDKRQWINVTGSVGNKSYPAFTLDGSLQKRDFNLGQTGTDSGWGQYILGTLGRGGNGLYMIDVSSRENPKAMWYRENVGGKLIRAYWTGNSGSTLVYTSDDLGKSDDADLGYLKLGFNSPKPAMGVAPAPAGRPIQNFIALAGGVQSQVPFDKSQNGKEGATLLFIEPKDGKLLKAFTGESLADVNWRVGSGVTGPAPYMGMMVSEPVTIRSAKNSYLTGSVITADNRGNIFRVEMEDRDSGAGYDPNQWAIRTLATLQTAAEKDTSDKSYSIPDGVVVGLENGGDTLWIAGGTSDVITRKDKNAPNEAGVISNESQMIFSFMSRKKTDTRTLTRNDLKEIKADEPGSWFSPGNESDAAFSGWHIKLKGRGQNNSPEYVSAKPLLVNGVLFIATFIPKKIATGDSSLCEPEKAWGGDSRIYAVDIRTGKPGFWSAQPGKEVPRYIELENTKVTGLIELKKGGKGKMLIQSQMTGKVNFDAISNDITVPTDQNGNLLPQWPVTARDLPKPRSNQGFPAGQTLINYWMMK